MHLMTQAKNNVSALELKRHLGVSYPTAWLLNHKIMQVMVHREHWRQLTSRVEIDDAYLGGEVRGGKANRGSPNKIPFVAAVQTTASGQPVYIMGNIKTSLSGTYHAFGFRKCAHRYLGEVQYLFNRCLDLRQVLEHLARASSRALPCPLRAVHAAEPAR